MAAALHARAPAEPNFPPDIASLIPNPDSAYQAGLSVSWEIDFWGRIRRLTEAARANVLATDEARRGVILSLVAAVTTNYLQLRGLDAQLVIAKQTLDTYGESLKLFNLQFKYGQISQMNVAQVQSQYETAAAQIPQIESQIAQTQTALSILLGRNPGPIERGKTIDELAQPDVPAGVPSELLERRPDLRQAEQALIAANAQIGAAKALYFPTISLTGAFGTASNDLSKLFSGPARDLELRRAARGSDLHLRRGERTSRAGRRRARRRAVELPAVDPERLRRRRQRAHREPEAQGPACRAGAACRGAAGLFAPRASCSTTPATSPYSTVLQAQQSLFPAELTLAAVRTSLLASSANIYKAMGGGWVATADAMSGSGVPLPSADPLAKPPLF